MEFPGATRQVHDGHANEAMDISESCRHLNQGKRQLSANDDQSQELRYKKRNNVRLDAQSDSAAAEPNSVDAPATGTLIAAKGIDEWIFDDLYDLDHNDLDRGCELKGFAANRPAATPKSPEEQTSDDIFWQSFSWPPSSDDDKPPPSVLREFYHVSSSTSAPEFDPTLQYSPPPSASPAVGDSIGSGNDVSESISWGCGSCVSCQLQQAYTDQVSSSAMEHWSINAVQSHAVESATPPSTAVSVPAGMLLRPYKAWFHLQEMLQAKESMYKNQAEVRFEFFARVVETLRENWQKKQLFMLRDLFKTKLPYISGVLLN